MIHENPAKLKYNIFDYESASRAEQQARPMRMKSYNQGFRPYKPIGHNTYIDRDGDNIRIILHSTAIVTYEPDGHIILNSGGYRTKTTKDRMNSVLPPGVRVIQKNYDWYVQHRNEPTKEFHDDMVIRDPNAAITNPTRREKSPSVHRNPGKFDNTVEEMLSSIDHDYSVSYEHGGGYYGLVSGLLKPDAIEFVRDNTDIDVNEFEQDAKQYDWPLNAILYERSDGIVEVTAYKSNREMMREWDKIVEEVEGGSEDERKNPPRRKKDPDVVRPGEIRRRYGDTTYWLRRVGAPRADLWQVTADGTAITGLKSRRNCLIDLLRVTGVDEPEPWVDKWEERDNVAVTLYLGVKKDPNDSVIVADWRDDDARQMVEDGFFKPGRHFDASVITYGEDMGLI